MAMSRPIYEPSTATSSHVDAIVEGAILSGTHLLLLHLLLLLLLSLHYHTAMKALIALLHRVVMMISRRG